VTIRFATRSAALGHGSLMALDVAGAPQVQRANGHDLSLEALGLITALKAADVVASRTSVELSPALDRALTLTRAGRTFASATTMLTNALEVVATRAHDLVVTPTPDDLTALLAAHASTSEVHRTFELSPADARWVQAHGATVVYTDGSADGTRALGAWGWYVDEELYDSGPVEHLASALTAERRAVREALLFLDGPLLVVSDCETVLTGRDVLAESMGHERALEPLRAGRPVRVVHTRGHADCPGNVVADHLAHEAFYALVADVDADPVADMTRRAEVAEANRRLASYRAFRSFQDAWCRTRRSEVIDHHYPHWSSMPRAERRSAGVWVAEQVRSEFFASWTPVKVPTLLSSRVPLSSS
jgi:ribonuclease HI